MVLNMTCENCGEKLSTKEQIRKHSCSEKVITESFRSVA